MVGIDPGSRATGFGVIRAEDGGRLVCLEAGCIRPASGRPLDHRLKTIFDGLMNVLHKHGPEEMAVEDVFFARNARSALALGHVRGVALLTAAEMGLPVFTYSARTIKKALVGYGQASKDQVNHMVQVLLGVEQPLSPDAADALACAVCHLNTRATLDHFKTRAG